MKKDAKIGGGGKLIVNKLNNAAVSTRFYQPRR